MATEAPENGVSTTLAASILSTATTCSLTSATGWTNAQYHCTITDGTNTEIVTASALSGTTLTIARASESWAGSSTAYAFSSGATITVTPTVQSVKNLINQSLTAPESIFTGPAGITGGLCLAQTAPRQSLTSVALSGANGILQIGAIYLPVGVTVKSFGWMSGTTAAVTPANQWAGLADSSFNILALTSDRTSAAIPANTSFQWAVANIVAGAATSFTTTYSGMYYLLLMINAGTQPSLIGAPAPNSVTALYAIPPIAWGYYSGSYTAPPTLPYTIPGITAAAGLRYLWASS